jgi:polyphenol oxidase
MTQARAPVTWLTPEWPAPSRVQACVTMRDGGVSEGAYASLNLGDHVGDEPEHVRVNRARLRVALALPEEPRWLRQVHGSRIVDFDRDADEALDRAADGAVTGRDGVVCVVMTADCLPVLFCDRDGRRVGVAHAGWRGLAAGVLEETVAAMNVPARELYAWIGPAISASAYEVGDEVRAGFSASDAEAGFTLNARGRWQADLPELARRILTRCDLRSIHSGGECTFHDKRFFSHRREAPCGRFATLIWLDGSRGRPRAAGG